MTDQLCRDRILAIPAKPPSLVIPDLTRSFARVPDPYPGPLKPAQSEWLYWCWKTAQDPLHKAAHRGVAGHMGVGSGKTLASYLTPLAAGLKRPLLLVPADLRDKTWADFASYYTSWKVPPQHTVLSYEELSSRKAATLLAQLDPDGVICDEVHNLGNPTAARTLRALRFAQKNPSRRWYVMSGTLLDIKDMERLGHLLELPLRDFAPIPYRSNYGETQAWGSILEPDGLPGPGDYAFFRKIHDTWAPDPRLWNAGMDERKASSRRAFQARARAVPGMVVTRTSAYGGALEITLRQRPPEIPEDVQTAIDHIEATWESPDGSILFTDATRVAQALGQLAQGFWYQWDWEAVRPGQGPDKEWMEARAFWGAEVRSWMTSRDQIPPAGLDSEALLLQACHDRDPRIPASMMAAYLGWAPLRRRWVVDRDHAEDAEGGRKIPVRTHWVSEFIIDDALAWAEREVKAGRGPVILWYHHNAIGRAFQRRAARRSDLDVYPAGSEPPQHKGAKVAPISAMKIASHGTGKNLQHSWANQLILGAFGNALAWEQLLGRTHREHQRADVVRASVNVHTPALRGRWERALTHTQASVEGSGSPAKLLLATIID